MTQKTWILTAFAALAAGVVYAQDSAPAAAKPDVGQTHSAPTGTISAGLTLNSGNSDAQTSDVGLTSEYKAGSNEWRLEADTAYGQEKGEKSVDNSRAKLNYHRLLTPRVFLFGEGSYARDDIADVSYRYVVSAGPGYYFLKGEKLSLCGEFGPGYLWENVGDEPAELTQEGMKFFLESFRILGLCVKEAPEFAAKKRMKAAGKA